MTFTPTPPDDLPTPEQMYEKWVELAQLNASFLAAQQATNSSLLASIADLYTKVGGNAAAGTWLWKDSVGGVTQGDFHVEVLTGNARRFTVSALDADARPVSLAALQPGSTLVLMDDPVSPPVTAFRQYVLVSPPVAIGNGPFVFNVTRVAIYGPQDFPTVGTPIRLLFG